MLFFSPLLIQTDLYKTQPGFGEFTCASKQSRMVDKVDDPVDPSRFCQGLCRGVPPTPPFAPCLSVCLVSKLFDFVSLRLGKMFPKLLRSSCLGVFDQACCLEKCSARLSAVLAALQCLLVLYVHK
jgi:hypothetical protein